jgi:hypothetical protein
MYARMFVLLALLLGFGAFNNLNALTQGKRPPESWLIDMLPTKVGDWLFVPDNPGSKITRKQDQKTYDELDPIGIGEQNYIRGNLGFNVVVIAGNQMESFHDQRWCFVAQGWTITEEKEVLVPTQSRGKVPAFYVRIKREGMASDVPAMFIFHGPSGYHATTNAASRDFFWSELTTGNKHIGFSYRFIAQWPGATEEDVKAFAGAYIDEAYKTSNGVL